MPEVEWSRLAQRDLLAIIDYISDNSPDAAQRLKTDIEEKTAQLPTYPKLYRPGRLEGTREMVVWANYIVVYCEGPFIVSILRILHAAQQWPPTVTPC